MEFMLIMLNTRGTPPGDSSAFQEMGKFAGELAASGKLKGGAPLHPETEGARIRVSGGRTARTDGPFAETKEVIGGFFMIECASREEALEVAARCPHARVGVVEVRQVQKIGPM